MAKTIVALVAQGIRKELKEVFPNVKFSVRSSNYSMGCSIRVEWDNLPTREAVEAITSKHSNVRRCDYTGEILSGGNMFIFCEPNFTPDFKSDVEAKMEEHEKEFHWYHRAFTRIVDGLWEEQQQNNSDGRKFDREKEEGESDEIESNNGNQAILNVNNEKNGIEIKFTSKPSLNIIAALKENGFKWTKFGGKWWTKQTPDRLKFASMLVESYNSIVVEEPMTDGTEAITEIETVIHEDVYHDPSKVVSLTNFVSRKVNKVSANITPEQKLKLYTIKLFLSNEEITQYLMSMSIDELFTYVANTSDNCGKFKEE